MAEYKGTYNPDKKRGELLKDNVATGEYFADKKGIFKDTSGLDLAKERADELNNPKKGFLDTVLGTKEQNDAAKERMAKEDAKSPDTVQAKVNRMINKIKPEEKKKGGKIVSKVAYKSGGKVRGCGIAQKGLTKGRMV